MYTMWKPCSKSAMSGAGLCPKNSPCHTQGRPGAGFFGATTKTGLPSTLKSKRSNPFHAVFLPGNGIGSALRTEPVSAASNTAEANRVKHRNGFMLVLPQIVDLLLPRPSRAVLHGSRLHGSTPN